MSQRAYEFKLHLKRLLKPRKKNEAIVQHNDVGISLKRRAHKEIEFVETYFAWGEVQNARAFKREHFLDNSVCLLFSNTAGVRLEVDEEMPEWESLINSLPNYLAAFPTPEKWYKTVGSYSLAPNWKVLYHADYPEEDENDDLTPK